MKKDTRHVGFDVDSEKMWWWWWSGEAKCGRWGRSRTGRSRFVAW